MVLVESFKHKIITVVCSFAVLGLAILSVFTLDIDLFPYADKDFMYVDLQGEVKGDITETRAFVEEVEKVLAKEEAITTYTSSVGGHYPNFI